MKRFFVLSAIIATFLLFGCGSKSGNNDSQNSSNPSDSTNQSPPAGQLVKEGGNPEDPENSGIPVEVTPVVRGDISNFLLYNSTLETEQMADIFSRISGLIVKLFVEEGDHVRKNRPLLQLEQDEYVLEEQKAKLQYDKQKTEFKRFEALKEKNLISEEEFENSRLSLRQAELQWKQAELNLDYTIIRSPINGVIGERLASVGDRIQPSTRLFVVSNLDEKVAKVFVPQDELKNCYLNQEAEIRSDILPDRSFSGWVKRISPIVDPTSGTFKVTAGVRDPRNLLRPGVFVNVKLFVDTHQNVTLVPKTALIYENERTYFFAVENDTVQKLELKKGFEDAEKVEVLNPIENAAFIVIVGQEGLSNRNRVKIINQKTYPWQKPSLEEAGPKSSKKATSEIRASN
ncbi:MAG: efflux RND transporter periplasmic adaptor subunit [Calditrichia bacterium]